MRITHTLTKRDGLRAHVNCVRAVVVHALKKRKTAGFDLAASFPYLAESEICWIADNVLGPDGTGAVPPYRGRFTDGLLTVAQVPVQA